MKGAKQPIFQRVRRSISHHTAAIYGMIGRMWLVLTGPVTIFFLAICFTPDAQGYFLTFITLAAARSVAELGLGQVIIVKVAQLCPLSTEPSSANAPQIAALVRFTAKWFLGAGLIVATLLCFGGWALLSVGDSLPTAEWLGPWLILGCLVGVDVALSGLLYPLEGAGLVRSVYFCRMIRSILNSVVLWTCMLLGLQLWAIAIALVFSLSWTVIYILSKGSLVVSALRTDAAIADIDWSSEILPTQWRVALSSIAEYLSFYTVVPLIYVMHGAVVAGQFGVTWQLALAVSSIAGAIVFARFPEFSRLAGTRSNTELDNLFVATAITSMLICLLGVLCVVLFVLFIDYIGMEIAARLLPFDEVAVVMLGVLVWHFNLAIVAYLRAHGGDPYLPASLTGAALLLVANVTLGRWLGPLALIWSYTLLGLFVMVPLGIHLLRRTRHAYGYPKFEFKKSLKKLISDVRNY